MIGKVRCHKRAVEKVLGYWTLPSQRVLLLNSYFLNSYFLEGPGDSFWYAGLSVPLLFAMGNSVG